MEDPRELVPCRVESLSRHLGQMDGRRRRLSSSALNSQPDIAIAARKGRKRHMALWNGLDRLNDVAGDARCRQRARAAVRVRPSTERAEGPH